MAGVLMFVMTGLAAAGGLVTSQRRAQAVADLAALAGSAQVEDDACGTAAQVALANGAALEGCRLDGDEVTLTVSVAGPRVPWREVRVTAEARAGPG
jgi:secretion/DNA translocation related TadE-like protein